MTTTAKLLYTVNELAEALGMCRDTINELFKRGEFDKVKIGRNTYVKADQVLAFIDRHTVRTDKEHIEYVQSNGPIGAKYPLPAA